MWPDFSNWTKPYHVTYRSILLIKTHLLRPSWALYDFFSIFRIFLKVLKTPKFHFWAYLPGSGQLLLGLTVWNFKMVIIFMQHCVYALVIASFGQLSSFIRTMTLGIRPRILNCVMVIYTPFIALMVCMHMTQKPHVGGRLGPPRPLSHKLRLWFRKLNCFKLNGSAAGGSATTKPVLLVQFIQPTTIH